MARRSVLAVDARTDRRDRYDRLPAYVVDGTNANERLVEQGHARVYDTDFGLAEQFYEHERRARDERRGLWRCRDPA
jgi:micrococcal nuclease